jgi:hypothetical protein
VQGGDRHDLKPPHGTAGVCRNHPMARLDVDLLVSAAASRYRYRAMRPGGRTAAEQGIYERDVVGLQ